MLRGIAAIVVAFNHALFIAGLPSVMTSSYLAVDFFFLLSGFVIAATFEERMPTIGITRFLEARWVRLWPMVAIGVALATIVHLMSGSAPVVTAAYAALALAFLPGPQGAFLLNNPMWSVHFELVANAVHAILLRRLSVLALALVAAGCFSIILIAQGWATLELGQNDQYLLGLPRVLLSYSLGILIWRINGTKARGPAWLAFALLPATILMASQVEGVDYIVALVVNPLILLCGLGFDEDSNYRPLARFIGAASFPLYALHWPIQEVVTWNGGSWLASFFWSVGGSIVVGLLFDRRVRAASFAPFQRRFALIRGAP